MPFDLDVRDDDYRDKPSLPRVLAEWCRAAPKRRVLIERARVGRAATVMLYRGTSRAHFPSVRTAIDALSTPKARARIVWLRAGGEHER